MPGLQIQKSLCDVTFVGQMQKLPIDWKQPQGDAGGQYRDAFPMAEHMHVPEPMAYFWAESTNKYHVDSGKDIGKDLKDFCHAVIDGFQKTIDMWKPMVMFQNVKIMGPVAVGAPGCLKGPDIEPFLKLNILPAASGNMQKWRDAAAKGLASSWKEWADNVTIPGLPLWPPFAAFPGPMAPPMPNVTPLMLIMCPSPGMAKMATPMLKQAMKDNFSLDDPKDHFGSAAMSIATAVNAAFMMWLPMQTVMLMGMGPIPTFAPPYVPVGPVLNGMTLPGPPPLAS